MTRRALLFLFAAPRSTRALNRAHMRFAKAYNSWQAFASALSPYSPNVWQRLRTKWLEEETGEKFRRVEKELFRRRE